MRHFKKYRLPGSGVYRTKSCYVVLSMAEDSIELITFSLLFCCKLLSILFYFTFYIVDFLGWPPDLLPLPYILLRNDLLFYASLLSRLKFSGWLLLAELGSVESSLTLTKTYLWRRCTFSFSRSLDTIVAVYSGFTSLADSITIDSISSNTSWTKSFAVFGVTSLVSSSSLF